MKRGLAFILIYILTTLFLSACTNNTGTSIPTAIPVPSTTDTPSPSQITAANTVFTMDIPNDEKKQAVEQIYNTVKRNFASWNTLTIDDWKAAYPVALQRALATNNQYDFYQELRRFVALLNDNHSYVEFQRAVYDELWFTPLRFDYFDGEYYIVGGKIDALQKLPQFSKIVKIDGVPIDTYMEQNVFPYIWHAKLDTAVGYNGSILARFGQPNTSQSFEVITPTGVAVTATIDRIPYGKTVEDWIDAKLDIDAQFEDIFSSDLLTIKRIDRDFLYVSIPTFAKSDVVPQFEAQMGTLKQAKGIILDVRGNNGGIAVYAAKIAGHFITGAYPDLYAEESTYDSQMDSNSIQKLTLPLLHGVGDITSPVVVLQDYLTVSAGEHFLDFMSHAQNVVSIGIESAGGTGDPIMVNLPGGGFLRLAKYKIARSDGTPFLNIGIQPDIFVKNTIMDYIKGHDAILDYGLAEIRKMCN